MAFIIKCDPFALSARQPGLLSVKRYEGATPEQGDQVFPWLSETACGAGPAGRGLVHAVSDEDPADIAIVIEAAAPTRPLSKVHLAPIATPAAALSAAGRPVRAAGIDRRRSRVATKSSLKY